MLWALTKSNVFLSLTDLTGCRLTDLYEYSLVHAVQLFKMRNLWSAVCWGFFYLIFRLFIYLFICSSIDNSMYVKTYWTIEWVANTTVSNVQRWTMVCFSINLLVCCLRKLSYISYRIWNRLYVKVINSSKKRQRQWQYISGKYSQTNFQVILNEPLSFLTYNSKTSSFKHTFCSFKWYTMYM